MELTWLEDFLAVLDEGGFSRAAERRGVSQPAFSRRIRSLEDWVGTTLFDRDTHSVRLTLAGERFQPAAEDILRRLRNARQEALVAAQVASATLRFAATHVLSLTFFPLWLRTMEAKVPATATVQLTADNMVACERLMLAGHAQFLLCHDHPAATSRLTKDTFRSTLLDRDVLLPVAAPALLAHGGSPTAVPVLAYTSESGMGRILAAAWAADGRRAPVKPAFASHLASVLAAMAREGRGVAWSPLSLVADDLAAGRLVNAGAQGDEIGIEIRLFRPKARQTPSAEAFWARVVDLYRDGDENGRA